MLLQSACARLTRQRARDLLTDEPFTRKDIIVLQDPQNLSGLTLDQFDHIRNERRVPEAPAARHANINAALSGDMARALNQLDTDGARTGACASRACVRLRLLLTLRTPSVAAFEAGGGGRAAQAERMLAAAKQACAAPTEAPALTGVIGLDAPLAVFKPGTHTWNTDAPAAPKAAAAKGAAPAAAAAAPAAAPGAARAPAAPEARPSAARAGNVGSATASMRSNGACAASFTSSAMTPVTRNEAAAPVHVARKAARKAYVALHTSHGDLNLQLHADIVPRAAENFLLLCARGFYDGVSFHRSIRNFMIQGGDPTGTGSGGQSAWGRPFADEFTSKLQHSGRGVLSMANSGPHSNGSQFFLMFKSAPHLDNKHTVFGTVVGGAETVLSAMERVPTDKEDRPLEPITIRSVTIFDNPFDDAPPEEAAAEEAAEEEEEQGQWWSNPAGAKHALVAQHAGVGKFVAALKPSAAAAPPQQQQQRQEEAPAAKRAKPAAGGFGDFSGW